ncbi:MAG: phosphoribosylformylglycinamidine synthase subunit PurS [Anaerolineales bacterium]|nr:phosphoribosylformylglycinamidine synthase subunit PurS [Anaerolineales bacterium]
MIYRVEISTKRGFRDARGENIRHQVEALGVTGLQAVSVADLYFLRGDLDDAAVQHLVSTLLCDPVVEQANWQRLDLFDENAPAVPGGGFALGGRQSAVVEVTLLPGVTDSVAESLLEGAQMAGLAGLEQAATGHRYTLTGDITAQAVQRIATRLLANEVIQTYRINQPVAPPFVPALSSSPSKNDNVELIPLTEADEAELARISQARRLSLDRAEMQAIQAYYRRERREPTDVELEMIAQTWSEHCVHKTFKAVITYIPDRRPPTADRGLPSAVGSQPLIIDSLLKTYIRAATERVNKPWVRSAFVDNAGIIAFDEQFDLAFKVETHNHPSALEPFGGANTGVGGVVRDIIGVSARPIANTDVLCFGPPDMPFDRLPAGVLHPRRIAAGVTAGIEDYGNKMGIPTVNGAIFYDEGYTANPLVFCGCLGLLPRDSHVTQPHSGDLIIVIGGRTGRDGLRGATFSSMEMTHETGEIAGSAVQIGHPIHEKQVLEAVLLARAESLYSAITDCGAGGLSSAVGEMAAELGAVIHLERVPLKYPGLSPWEIWLSEAQERMVLAVPPTSWPRLQQICRMLDVPATELGLFSGDGCLRLYDGERLVGQLATDFLHEGIPQRRLNAVWSAPVPVEPDRPCPPDLTGDLLALLALPDTRSKEDVVRGYDHEVQGGSVVKPFVGPAGFGPSDAAVLAPLDVLRGKLEGWKAGRLEGWKAGRLEGQDPQPHPLRGVALAVGINPAYGLLDPYAMAWAAIDEAMRNCVAVGADPDRLALLDNFCWGNPSLPDRLGSLVRCAQGCYDAAVAYGAPFISGKDSLNNEYTGADGQKHAIPGTLLISAVGIVPDVARTVTSDLKQSGNLLYVVGLTKHELGGSTYYRRHHLSGGQVPQQPQRGLDIFRALHRAIGEGLVRACHDCSEGGLAVAAAEMALGGGWGLELNLGDVPHAADVDRADVLAFSESLARFIVEVKPDDGPALEAMMAGLPVAQVGSVREDEWVCFKGLDGQVVIETDLKAVERAWRGHQ